MLPLKPPLNDRLALAGGRLAKADDTAAGLGEAVEDAGLEVGAWLAAGGVELAEQAATMIVIEATNGSQRVLVGIRRPCAGCRDQAG